MSSYPPRNKDGSYRDERSNTVEDAVEFEHYFNSHMYDDECDDEYDEDEDEDEDDCNCSDPCCPCGGRKRGTP